MIINNNNSTIYTQNNTEVTINAAAIHVLQEIMSVITEETTLSVNTKQTIQHTINATIRELEEKKLSKDYLTKSLDALKDIGSIARLLSKFFDLFQ